MRDASPKRQLTLFDSTCIIVGIIVGAGIYQSTPLVAQSVGSSLALFGAFALGALISLLGALCIAELATAYPREGGTYVFLTRAFGRRAGFLFAWAEFWLIRPGNIGAMAYVFALYAGQLAPLPGVSDGQQAMIYALGSLLLMTGVNALGVVTGKWTQNVLTTIKILGLLAIVGVGLWVGVGGSRDPVATEKIGPGGFRLAMILVLFAYGGWNEMSYVAAEVRDPRRNILRALVAGTLAVAAIYLLFCVAAVAALGFQGVRSADALASQIVADALGRGGSIAISVLICISSLGAINGMVFTGARVFYALGTEHRLYAWLGKWNERVETPLRSLLLQGAVTIALVALFGLRAGSFERLVTFTAPWFWLFLFLVGIALFLLRMRDRHIERPFRVPLYPLTPLLFCLSSLFMLDASATHAWSERSAAGDPWHAHAVVLWPLAIMLVGVVASFFDPPLVRHSGDKPAV
jgi:amino acid transporter